MVVASSPRPTAGLRTPTFEVCLFERTGRPPAIGYALALFTGLLPRLESYRLLAARRIEIEGPAGEPVQADGDIIARLPVRIEVLPAALELIFPPRSDALEAPAVLVAERPLPAQAEVLAPAANAARQSAGPPAQAEAPAPAANAARQLSPRPARLPRGGPGARGQYRPQMSRPARQAAVLAPAAKPPADERPACAPEPAAPRTSSRAAPFGVLPPITPGTGRDHRPPGPRSSPIPPASAPQPSCRRDGFRRSHGPPERMVNEQSLPNG